MNNTVEWFFFWFRLNFKYFSLPEKVAKEAKLHQSNKLFLTTIIFDFP